METNRVLLNPLPLDIDEEVEAIACLAPLTPPDDRVMALWRAMVSDPAAIQRWAVGVASGEDAAAQPPPSCWTLARERALALHDSLDLEIGKRLPGRESVELIVTCNGLLDALPMACAVYRAAPRIPGLRITLLRQRRIPSIEFCAGDEVVSAVRLRLAVGWQMPSRGLFVALRTLDHFPGATDAWMSVAFDVLDEVLGEQDVMGKVTTVQWMASTDEARVTWMTLDEFPDVFDSVWRKSMQ